MRPWHKGNRGEMKAYVWMERKIYLMTSGTTEKVRKVVVLTGIMQKTVLKRAVSTLARSKEKP